MIARDYTVTLMGDENQNIRNTIRKDFQRSEEYCDEMFSQWLQYTNGTWQNVIDALKSNSVRKLAAAKKLMELLGVFVCVFICVCVLCLCLFIHRCVCTVYIAKYLYT